MNICILQSLGRKADEETTDEGNFPTVGNAWASLKNNTEQ